MTRAVTQFGILAPLVPVAFVVTASVHALRAADRDRRGDHLFFNASYINADINRYYLGPVLIAWTWLAILAAVAVELLASVGGEQPLAEDLATADDGPDGDHVAPDPGWATPGPRAAMLAVIFAVALLIPTVVAAPDRLVAVDASRTRDAQIWVDRTLQVMEPDAAVISWWSYSTPLWYAQRVQGERPDITIIDDRTRLDEKTSAGSPTPSARTAAASPKPSTPTSESALCT